MKKYKSIIGNALIAVSLIVQIFGIGLNTWVKLLVLLCTIVGIILSWEDAI